MSHSRKRGIINKYEHSSHLEIDIGDEAMNSFEFDSFIESLRTEKKFSSAKVVCMSSRYSHRDVDERIIELAESKVIAALDILSCDIISFGRYGVIPKWNGIDINTLKKLAQNKYLTSLKLGVPNYPEEAVRDKGPEFYKKRANAFKLLMENPVLKHLTIQDITPNELKSLPKNTSIISLELLEGTLDKECMKILAQSNVSSLKLNHCKINDVEDIVELRKSKTISALHLKHINIGDLGAKALAKMPSLISLKLENNGIGDKGLKALTLNNNIISGFVDLRDDNKECDDCRYEYSAFSSYKTLRDPFFDEKIKNNLFNFFINIISSVANDKLEANTVFIMMEYYLDDCTDLLLSLQTDDRNLSKLIVRAKQINTPLLHKPLHTNNYYIFGDTKGNRQWCGTIIEEDINLGILSDKYKTELGRDDKLFNNSLIKIIEKAHAPFNSNTNINKYCVKSTEYYNEEQATALKFELLEYITQNEMKLKNEWFSLRFFACKTSEILSAANALFDVISGMKNGDELRNHSCALATDGELNRMYLQWELMKQADSTKYVIRKIK